MIRAILPLLVAVVACGTDDPCDGKATCVRLDVTSASVDHIDQLELDVLYGGVHSTLTVDNGSHTTELPAQTAIDLDIADSVNLGVVAAGKLSGSVLGTGAGHTMIAPGEHAVINIELAVPEQCTVGGHYCGGDKLAGDPMTLYTCNGGGVPVAVMRCKTGCTINVGSDDACQ